MTAILSHSLAINFNSELGIIRNVDIGRHSLLLFLDSSNAFVIDILTETSIVVLGTAIVIALVATVRLGTIVVGTTVSRRASIRRE